MTRRSRRVTLERLRMLSEEGGATMRFFVRPGSRRGPWIWLDPEDVPDFCMEEAEAEIERVEGRWRVVRLLTP
jgi:hypothetical protein